MFSLSILTDLLNSFYTPTIFVGAFFFGESVIITAAYLAAQLEWSMAALVVASFVGTISADVVWFFIGRYIQKHSPQSTFFLKQRERLVQMLSKLTGQRPFQALLFVKFLYGSRITMIVYIASRQVSFQQFIIYNSVGTLLWLAVIIPIGYAAGRGVARALPLVNAIQASIFVLVISAIAYRIFSLWLTTYFKKNP